MACIVCRYFHASEPPEHKADREAGRCQSMCGDKWDWHTAVSYIRNHDGKLEGWCYLHPKAVPVNHDHVCGDISVMNHFHNHGWGVPHFNENDNLFEWAGRVLAALFSEDAYGVRRDLDAQQIAELRRQLKRARAISASRLKRLQKPKSKQSEQQEVPEPFRPHLVAAE